MRPYARAAVGPHSSLLTSTAASAPSSNTPSHQPPKLEVRIAEQSPAPFPYTTYTSPLSSFAEGEKW